MLPDSKSWADVAQQTARWRFPRQSWPSSCAFQSSAASSFRWALPVARGPSGVESGRRTTRNLKLIAPARPSPLCAGCAAALAAEARTEISRGLFLGSCGPDRISCPERSVRQRVFGEPLYEDITFPVTSRLCLGQLRDDKFRVGSVTGRARHD